MNVLYWMAQGIVPETDGESLMAKARRDFVRLLLGWLLIVAAICAIGIALQAWVYPPDTDMRLFLLSGIFFAPSMMMLLALSAFARQILKRLDEQQKG